MFINYNCMMDIRNKLLSKIPLKNIEIKELIKQLLNPASLIILTVTFILKPFKI